MYLKEHLLFANKTNTTVQLLEKVKIYSLRWLKTKNVCFPFGYHMWLQNLLPCLGLTDVYFHRVFAIQDYLM